MDREGRAHKGAGRGARRRLGGQTADRAGPGLLRGRAEGLWGCGAAGGAGGVRGRLGERDPRRPARAGGRGGNAPVAIGTAPRRTPRPGRPPEPLGAWLTSTGPGGPRCTSVPCGGRLCPRSGRKLPRPGRQPRPQPSHESSHAAPPAWERPGTSARGRGSTAQRRPANRGPAPQRRSQWATSSCRAGGSRTGVCGRGRGACPGLPLPPLGAHSRACRSAASPP